MRLSKPFYRLPVRFDVPRLAADVAALPADAWAKHPNEIAGNSCVRLISVDGGENDDVNGVMRPTPQLERSPYLKHALASFGVVWSRSRLLRLAPGARVPEHADINYHWFNRVRLHIPIVTRPEVRFHCGGQTVHMAAGEAWVFDNWRLHSVENPTDQERIHLVADTSGSAAFWQLVARDDSQELRPDPSANVPLLTEHTLLAPVMSPAEIELLTLDLRAELTAQTESPESNAKLTQFHGALDGFCRDWRQLYALYGATPAGWPEFTRLRDALRTASRTLTNGLMIRSNRVGAQAVLEGRILRTALSLPSQESLRRPVFIVAAPRSGSTLLFETLAASEALSTLGGEAHWLVESIPELRPGAPGVDSNRLDARHATEEVRARIVQQVLTNVQGGGRLLEKTPKNALRIPFFAKLFPDALFIFLWREPHANIASIMEAWRSGKLRTYNGLEGFDEPWSMLLPPGWQALRDKPLEEIAAYQWETTNRIALDDLAALPRERWISLCYTDLVSQPQATVRRLCGFAGIPFDGALAERSAAPLPLSRYTLSAPHPEKWRRDAAQLSRVLPSVEATWQRLQALK